MKDIMINIGCVIDLITLFLIAPLLVIIWVCIYMYHCYKDTFAHAFIIVPCNGIMELCIDCDDNPYVIMLGYSPIAKIFKK